MKTKTVVILQSNYVPWKGYFDLIHDADVFVFYDEVKYTKNDWRNRNKLYSHEGAYWLTIPIDGKATHQKISEVELTNQRWQGKHYKSVYFTYKNAPYFFQLEPLLKDLYLENTWTKLVDINRYFITLIANKLKCNTVFKDAKEYGTFDHTIDNIFGILEQEQANRYITGPSAKKYIQEAEPLFKEKKIELIYKDYTHYPAYQQNTQPFLNQVSIIDMIAFLPWEEIPFYIWGENNGKLIMDNG